MYIYTHTTIDLYPYLLCLYTNDTNDKNDEGDEDDENGEDEPIST